MAQMVGTTPETFSRTLRSIAAEGVIEVDRLSIRIRNPQSLHRIAGATHS